MSKEGFFSAVRQACRLAGPTLVTDSEKLDAGTIELQLRGTDLWLTSRVVEGYDPEDYRDLPTAAQETLANAIEGFRRVASAVPPDAPATRDQRDEAWGHFSRILRFVREYVTAEWLGAVEFLFQQAESLAVKREWGTKRFPKTLADSFLGAYEVTQLLIHRPDARFMLDPVARYAPGTTGLVDLYVMPSLGGTVLTRANGIWRIHPPQPGQPLQPWSEAAFLSALDGLARAAA